MDSQVTNAVYLAPQRLSRVCILIFLDTSKSKQILYTLRSNTLASYALQDLLVKRGNWYPWLKRTDCVVPDELLDQLSATIPSCHNLKKFELVSLILSTSGTLIVKCLRWNVGNPLPDNVVQFLNAKSVFQSLGLFAASFGSKEEPQRTWRLPASRIITNLKVCIGWEHPHPDVLPKEFRMFIHHKRKQLYQYLVRVS